MKRNFKMPDGEIVSKEHPDWKTPYNHDTNFESDRTATFCKDESLTKQEFVDDADINTIMNRLTRGAMLDNPAPLPEHFMDISDKMDYFTMQSRIADANKTFYMLPAELRARFSNNPATWADAVVDAVNRQDHDEIEELGLEANRPPVEPPTGTAARPATPAASAAPGAPQAPKQGDTPATPGTDTKK